MDRSGGVCSRCGTPYAPGAKFCDKCGQPVIAAGRPIPPPAAPAKKGPRNVWIVCGVLAGIGVLAGLCLALVGGLVWTETIPLPGLLSGSAPTVEAASPAPALPPTTSTPPAASEPIPEPTAAEAPPPVDEKPGFTFTGLSLTADPALGKNIKGEVIQPPEGPDLPPWELYPAYVEASFLDYPLQGKFHEPHVMVFPLEAYYDVSPTAKDTVNLLKKLLEKKNPAPDKAIPFLPEWNAAQFFHSNVEFLDFKNGSGVRFLTMYGQAAYPVNNDGLFYCFQGITTDGQYYISAVLPVNHPSLPASGDEIPNGDFEAFAEGFPDYLKTTSGMLSGQTNSSFTPDLALLDGMISSMEIH